MYILRLHCDDKPGIVAAVATALADNKCNIEESSQFNDPFSGQFFMRVVFAPLKKTAKDAFENAFKRIAKKFAMTWQITPVDAPVRTLVLVSKQDHCLNDLLYRWRTRHLNIDIVGIVSNHETCRNLAEEKGIPYYFLPVTDKNKKRQESDIAKIIEKERTELIVLARYMQILSNDLCRRYTGRIINIHHSFLPGFKGAKPYHQAYERGVKIIGATAHFATADLDEGPIIEQETVRITHATGPEKMQALGQDTESQVLARAIRLYTERRVFLHGNRTVIL
ncbi:MAG TPA: formyltetrahydrofolate deformylase [Rhodospirillaceae bacterium]|nr:formyltetrahydrofolate deformylase [Rhodospirillaceae bacterium]